MIELVPVVIQGSNKPCFRIGAGTGDKLFCDSGCGQVLIENYFKENFIGIVLRCFQCGTITKTPGLEAGEVLANRIVNFGNDGQFLLMSTVDVPACVSLTCDNEIRRELEFSAPRSGGSTLDLSEQGLNELIANYEILSEGKFELQIRIVRRLGIRSAKEFPFAWAIDHLKQCIQKQTIDIKDHQTVTAIVWVMTFKNILLIWGHNPRFTKIGRDLAKPNSFLHTAAQLIVAAYLFNNNNRVGLSLEYEPARPNPDLYIRFGNGQKFFLEVKAPKALQ